MDAFLVIGAIGLVLFGLFGVYSLIRIIIACVFPNWDMGDTSNGIAWDSDNNIRVRPQKLNRRS